MSIFSVILFAFALTLSSCGESNADKASVECSADCAKACCLGCKATEGESSCKEDHSCCAPSDDNEKEVEAAETSPEDVKSDAAPCCCGDETCDGSCHADEKKSDHDH